MQYWAMMAVRGGFGIALGLAVLVLPTVGLGELVALFGVYAILDGIAAAFSAVGISRRSIKAWPVLLEGLFSIGLGVVALADPFQSARFIYVVALWAFVTGILEILAAVRVVSGLAPRTCLAAGGAWSIFLAVFVLALPHALTDELVIAIGLYALVFGILVSVAAVRLRRVVPPSLIGTVEQTWTTR